MLSHFFCLEVITTMKSFFGKVSLKTDKHFKQMNS